MKKQVPVEELKFGVYIHALDRPWIETPFMFQGFVLNSDAQLQALKKYCKKVFIDTDKGSDLPSDAFTTDPFASRIKPPGVLSTIKKPVIYEQKASISAETPIAIAARGKAEVVLNNVFNQVKAGKALDAERVREAVSSMTDSVVRNPDAMMLLAKMKEKGERNLDRALGVSIYMITFGRYLHLPREELDLLGMLGLLQDVGKVRLPDDLLDKADPLNEVEMKVCQSHVRHSFAILKETPGLPLELPSLAALHHERYDGSGYPNGLKAGRIGLFGGIAGLVDCFDALTYPRPYANTVSPSNALGMLYDMRDVHFDGPLVEQFIQCIGIYPVGAIVELYSSEIGIVIAQNPSMRLLPRIMVVLDAKGNRLTTQKIIEKAQVKRTLEKGSVDIDPSEYFL
jgi:cyclic di-GMP phosphodiesterase